jgi:hypothetical protein
VPIEDDAWGNPVPLAADAAGGQGPAQKPPHRRPAVLAAAGAAALIVVVVVVVVLLASVGGESGGGGSKALTKAQWIQKADAICGSTFPQQAQAQRDNDLAKLAALAQQTLTEIRALGLPTEGASQVKQYENGEQQVLNLVEQAVATQRSDPSTSANDLQQASQLIQANAALAGRFGMQVCNAGQ